jgi:hemerythrin-like metal-binding protein
MSVDWRQLVDIGYPPIDEEHQELADLLIRFIQAVQRGTSTDIDVSMAMFFDRAAAHFAHEERLMRESAWTELERHMAAHNLFLTDFGQMTAEFHRAHQVTPAIEAWAVTRLVEWFAFHIRTNDAPLGEFLATRERNGTLDRKRGPEPQASN